MITVSIVTGTYNRLPHLKRMVESCRRSVGKLAYEIILVDGGSTDGTIQWCREQPDVILIEQGELLGAIKAFNAGCQVASGDYVAILNDDIEVAANTLERSYHHLHNNPHIGQIAFENQVTGTASRRPKLDVAYGFLYGQCSLTPRWLGDYAGWWGEEGMKTYGGDTRLSLRLWELGYPTVSLEGCAIIDHVADDELRKINSDEPWEHARKIGQPHPDVIRFRQAWNGRLPSSQDVISACNPATVVLEKAARGNLRTLRFKGMMTAGDPMRTALINEFQKLGVAKQVDQAAIMQNVSNNRVAFQRRALKMISDFKPDLIILQAQRENNFTPQSVMEIRQHLPETLIVNFDGDAHGELKEFHAEIAQAVHLQCVVSPYFIPRYAERGIAVSYWPIGVEWDYAIDRAANVDGPDVVFMGALYREGLFPEGQTREDAVVTLMKEKGLNVHLFGTGWDRIGLHAEYSGEQHAENAKLYSRSKMALSISAFSGLWGYSSDRLYNITATGCPVLLHKFAGMDAHGFVDGETCIAWSTVDEMMDKVRYYVKHDDEREKIGLAGQQVTLSRHTWPHRVDGLFTMIETLSRVEVWE